MDKVYNHLEHEKEVYKLWERAHAFSPPEDGEKYTILMPPPNANASLHAGHAMYTIDDILVRWKRMQGLSALWIPGMDHAGFETQYVYEKELAKKGLSRMDFDRESLYENIYEFVQKNSGLIYEQFKRLGFSADWDRSVFTLDKKVTDYVTETFKSLEKDGFVYRDNYIVNYCTHCGTSLAELEVNHIERTDPLYFINYPLSSKKDGFITIATVRPETIFADSAIAVNPKDKRYKNLIGQKVTIPLTNRQIPIIKDELVDIKFGTGALKITPAHDPLDFEVGKKHNLQSVSIINTQGRLTYELPWIKGKKVKAAREETVNRLQKEGFLEKVKNDYFHAVTVCYKCKRDLEPTVIPNWYIKVDTLKDAVKKAVEKDRVKFFPSRFKKHMLSWLTIMHDWPISRQIVWGIRVPVWYKIDKSAANILVWWLDKKNGLMQGSVQDFLKKGISLEEIERGLQKVQALTGNSQPEYVISQEKPSDGNLYLPETDTFDTWFSSGQWPLVTLQDTEFKNRFPTNVLGTLSDILKFWVSRMIMFSLYRKSGIPFKDVYLWSMVADEKGIKMSKSKGNVINPLDLADKYGADALRMSLLYGIPAGSKVILSDAKVKGMRNFANKVWNVARYILTYEGGSLKKADIQKNRDIKWILNELEGTTNHVTKSLAKYRFNDATESIYEFIWHKFADIYIEKTKDGREIHQGTLELILKDSLKLLHPFMPFVTEAIWSHAQRYNKEVFDSPLLITAPWPTQNLP